METNNKWELHRAGLLNFWYYDEEYFDFADGKLLLRGSNGSGKSVTMQSFLPVLLDGKKSPDRLDPFGSKARRMEDYLLGEKEVVNRDERTGYLFLEYKRKNTEQYITTGIGLRAKRHKSLDFWGFAILDNRRIGIDMKLYKEEKSLAGEKEKVPFTRRELENRLETGGQVVRTQKEYMDLVNKHVFGFENIEAYEELIKLLIQLRSPKLSKDFKPTVIYEILNNSLPPLSDDELRPLSETIENMDQTKQQLDQLAGDEKALKQLCRKYDAYNEFILAEKAQSYIEAYKQYSSYENKINNFKEKLETDKKALVETQEKQVHLSREKEVLEKEVNSLRHHEVFQAENQKIEAEEKLSETEANLKNKEVSLEEKEDRERKIKMSVLSAEEEIDELREESADIVEDLEELGEEAGFIQHDVNEEDFLRNSASGYSFQVWNREGETHQSRLENALRKWQEYTQKKARYEEASWDYGETKKQLETARVEERKWEQYFSEEKDRLLSLFHVSIEENKHFFQLTKEEIREFSLKLTELFEPYSFEEAKAPLRNAIQRYTEKVKEEKLVIEGKISASQKQLQETETELKEWQQKKDPEPPRHEKTADAREKLKKANVPFVPFFAAVEFREHVMKEQRERIESAAEQTGLLDALIIPESAAGTAGENDRVIKAVPQIMAPTLADWLYPVPEEGSGVSGEEIDNVLRSVLTEAGSGEGETSVSPDGAYRIGLLQGHAPEEAGKESKFIGKEARRRYRRQRIDELQADLEVIRSDLMFLEREKQELTEKLEDADESYASLPGEEDVRTAFLQFEAAKRNTLSSEKDTVRKNDLMKKALESWEAVKHELNGATRDLPLDHSLETYDKAKTSMSRYLKKLYRLEIVFSKQKEKEKLRISLEGRLSEIIADGDELKGELTILEDSLEKIKLQLKHINERLALLGAEDIRRKIRELGKKLEEAEQAGPALIREEEDLKHNISRSEEELAKAEGELRFYSTLTSEWEAVFLEEYKLGFFKLSEDLCKAEEGNPLKIAGRIVRSQAGVLSGKTDRNKVSGQLSDAFYKSLEVLIEYRLTQEPVHEWGGWPADEQLTDVMEMRVNILREKARRIQILMEYNGQRVSPYYVLREIEEDIQIQKTVLDERDRELYEEIILNSVGRIIRGRINRAEQWVKKINDLMIRRNSSSGLTFSIKWKPLTAEVEEEMDTAELVQLLRTDVRLLKDEDMESVIHHFRSKINRAKELMNERGFGDTLHQVIKEILDYRQWFSFTLFYRREGENRKELTNNVFFTFSGGEKAMAMYIPLFSAAYSRYQEADKDAPFIISLDEAFAGVDENNIRDMFELVEQLGFNYIMNSQAIWGDYDTVSKLSVAELVRPKNADFVSVVRYLWDGKVKHLLNDIDAAGTQLVAEEV